ncbi:hypothetical protein NA57DRAFT_59020 [Rhizodiscina lignyota]|uniref:Uncharacterized protein n=1 Tax=Rhizodiscina lignyota TaxID=1504668 RepID=A0A9P4ICD6_9PEZI|nr:hypothetical protein NA57DRAFT_59020 [Rhizodiscina lignyota]
MARNLHFFDLPREVRDIVYTYALTRPSYRTWGGSLQVPDCVPSLNLLLVSRHIHDEAMPVFYSSNIFQFSSAAELLESGLDGGRLCHDFLLSRRATCLRSITSIEFDVGLRLEHGAQLYPALGRTLAEQLQLKHLGLHFYWGNLPNTGQFPWTHIPSHRRPSRSDKIDFEQDLQWMRSFWNVKDLKSLRLKICSADIDEYGCDRDRLVTLGSFLVFIRSKLLRGGRKLGTRGIQVHTYTRTYTIITCFDDEFGNSLLRSDAESRKVDIFGEIESVSGRYWACWTNKLPEMFYAKKEIAFEQVMVPSVTVSDFKMLEEITVFDETGQAIRLGEA